MSASRGLLLRLGLSLTSVVVLLVLLELVVRETVTNIRSLKPGAGLEADPEFLIKYTGTGRRLVPNASVVINNHYLSGEDVLFETNSHGYRHRELANPPPPNHIRILALGDSITVGDHVNQQDTVSAILERSLRTTYPPLPLEVINTGVMDIGLREELDILQESLALKPQIVILNFYLNDSRPSWGFADEIRYRGWLRRHSVLAELIYSRLKLAQWVKEQGAERFDWIRAQHELDWKTNERDYKRLIETANYDWGSAWQDQSWQQIIPLLEELQRLSEDHGFSVLVVGYPVRFQVYSDVYDTYPQDRLSELSEKYKFTYVDLLPALRAANDRELFFDQCHPIPQGYQIIAEAILPSLSTLVRSAAP